MKINQTPNSERAEQARTIKGRGALKAKRICLGIDAHLQWQFVGRKVDHAGIQPTQRMSRAELLLFGQKQLELAEEVYAVYEAGPLGYGLCRELQALGIKAYVCAPESLESGTPGRKHNKLDGHKLAGRLASYLDGDRHMLRRVRVPSVFEEQLQAQSRQYDQLERTRKAMAAQGRSLLLKQGYAIRGKWWRPRAWSQLQQALMAGWILELLEPWRASLKLLDSQIRELKKKLIASVAGPRPKGYGALTLVQVQREICDWQRFSNGRRVACFLGLCPGEKSSGFKQRLGRILPGCNRRLRAKIIELVWRLVVFQPQYRPIQKWVQALRSTNPIQKKKAAVAVARQVVIDWWRIQTGRVQPEQLGLAMIG